MWRELFIKELIRSRHSEVICLDDPNMTAVQPLPSLLPCFWSTSELDLEGLQSVASWRRRREEERNQISLYFQNSTATCFGQALQWKLGSFLGYGTIFLSEVSNEKDELWCPDRFPRVMMTPFSVEKASEGRPLIFQCLTAVGLDRKTAKLKPGEQGTCKFWTWGWTNVQQKGKKARKEKDRVGIEKRWG